MAIRDKFYKSYYTFQESRHGSSSLNEATFNSQWILAKEVLSLVPTDRDSVILDLGCGYGSLVSMLKNNGYSSVKGVDISEEQVQKAQELGISEVVHSDLFNYLNKDDITYDCIIGIDIIEHFSKEELMKLLSLIKTKLKKSGKVIFRTPNGDAPFGSTYYYGDFTHEVVLNYFSAEQIMLTSGFNSVEILSSCVKVPGFLKNLIRSILWPFVKFACKIILFASGKSTSNLFFTPNLIITAIK